MSPHRFTQVDVFSDEPFGGNPVAVVHDADGLPDDELARFASWTNLSETTFLLAPTDPRADYRLRIFTPGRELPFAGHPTLGSCRAWLAAGGVPRTPGRIVQQCGAGLIEVADADGRLAFAAPPLVRSGAADGEVVEAALHAVGLGEDDVVGANWVDNGPGWLGLLLTDAAAVLRARPDRALLGDLSLGLVGPHPAGADADVEVRAFDADLPALEDPVTGSLNAGLAQWLIEAEVLPGRYVAAQGTALGRTGRVHINGDADAIWVGGTTAARITGTVDFSR